MSKYTVFKSDHIMYTWYTMHNKNILIQDNFSVEQIVPEHHHLQHKLLPYQRGAIAR